MRAIVVRPGGGHETAELPPPSCGDEDVVVRVRAVGLNRADLTVLAGRSHGASGGAGAIVGMEWAGEVTAVGARVNQFKAGDRVAGTGAGALAEMARAHVGRVMPVPRDDMDWEHAASLPMALQTMHDALVTNGAVERGQSVLIQGASSVVGLMGIRIATHLGAATVFGSSRDRSTRARLLEFGCDYALDSMDANWPEEVLDVTDGRGVDVIIDMLAGETATANMAACAVGGRIVNVGRLAGQRGAFDFDLHALRRIHYVGVTFRTRTPQEVAKVVASMRADLWPAVQRGQLAVPLAAVYPMDRAGDAFERLRRGDHWGKLVISVP